jgi:hypothetical protein
VPGNGNKVLRRVEIKKNVLVTGEAGWCLPGCFKVLRFFIRKALGSNLQNSIKHKEVSSISCGLARPRSLVGGKPTQVAVSHGPGIEPCRCSGNRMLDA